MGCDEPVGTVICRDVQHFEKPVLSMFFKSQLKPKLEMASTTAL